MLQYLSILVAIILSAIPFFIPTVFNNLWYMLPASFVGSIIMLISWPSFAHYLFKKPLYYDDLIDKYANDDYHAKRYQRIFEVLNILFSAILVTMVVYYAVQRIRWEQVISSLSLSEGLSLDWFETLGVIGGVIGLYRKWQMIFGRWIMRCLFRWKQSEEAIELE